MSTNTYSALTSNGLRQALRIACGSTLDFLICKVVGWNYGVFFTIFPILLLGLTPILSPHVIRQYIANSIVTAIEILVIAGLFGDQFLIMIIFAFCLFLYRFILMSKGPLFFFGAFSLVNVSIQLHLSSYPRIDIYDLVFSNLIATLLTVCIALLMHWLFPNVDPISPPPRPIKESHHYRHEVLLGTSIATLSFISFQVLDLNDALAAQVATVLILFPLRWRGIIIAAEKRIIGTYIGSLAVLITQLVLYHYISEFVLVLFVYWICMLYFAKVHVTDVGMPGIGFSGITTIAIIYGQFLSPESDITFDTVHRLISVTLAVVITLSCVYLIHLLLNKFEVTRIE